MAYRKKARYSGRRGNSSRRVRGSGSRRSSGRSRGSSRAGFGRGGGNTLRIVLEQPSPNPQLTVSDLGVLQKPVADAPNGGRSQF